MNILKKSSIISTLCYAFLLAFALNFASCSDDDDKKVAETISDPVIEKLDALIAEMTDLKDNSVYGLLEGMFPASSKSILEEAISAANRDILLIKYGETQFTDSEKDNFVKNAQDAITTFNATKRTEDGVAEPAYLFVDGNNGGYIDFGYSDDYVKFGNQGQQSFTIELWVKITDYCNKPGEDNSTFLSTYISDGSYNSGWRVQSRNRNILRGSVGIIDVNNNNRHMWEPNLSFSNTNEWVHFTFIYSDLGNEEHPHIRSKVFKNGLQSGEVIRIGETERQYNSAASVAARKPMTAFARFELNGDRNEYFSGYIRNMRIWKVIKTEAEIKDLYDGAAIDPADPNLVCAWNFDETPADNSNIKDLTGRHSAKLVGSFRWEPR